MVRPVLLDCAVNSYSAKACSGVSITSTAFVSPRHAEALEIGHLEGAIFDSSSSSLAFFMCDPFSAMGDAVSALGVYDVLLFGVQDRRSAGRESTPRCASLVAELLPGPHPATASAGVQSATPVSRRGASLPPHAV